MSQATLQAKIEAELQIEFGTPTDTDKRLKFSKAMSKAIIAWFDNDAVSGPGSFESSEAVTGVGDLVG